MTEADTPSCTMDDSASGWEEKCWSILEGIEMYASTRPKRLETTGQVASPAKAPTAPAPPRSTGTFVLIELAGDRPTEFFAGSASFRGVPLFFFFFLSLFSVLFDVQVTWSFSFWLVVCVLGSGSYSNEGPPLLCHFFAAKLNVAQGPFVLLTLLRYWYRS